MIALPEIEISYLTYGYEYTINGERKAQ